jgi:hypothetical protein
VAPDLLIVLPMKAEDAEDWCGVVGSEIRAHDKVLGNEPNDEESYRGCAHRGKKSRSDD